MPVQQQTPFDRAVEIVGTKAKLATILRVSAQALSQWNPERILPEHCPAIEIATAGRVRCEALRPDLEWQRDDENRITGYVVSIASKVA